MCISPLIPPRHLLTMAVLFTLMILSWTASAVAGTFSLTLGDSFRRDSLDWNIAGDSSGRNPNILSELTWKSIRIFQLSGEGIYRFGQQSEPSVAGCLKGRAGYGWIYAGKNQDSDYLGDNRTSEFSRSNNSADDGRVVDLLAGGGVRFAWLRGRLSVMPLAGVSYHRQSLTISNGYQTIPDNGPFPGLNSSYTAEWFGPWIGADFDCRPASRLTIATGMELHNVRYYGEGNWNLRSDLQHPRSFKHEGYGFGLVLSQKFSLRLARHFAVALQGRLEKWRVDDGEDTIYFSNGTIGKTRLNEVNHSVASGWLNMHLYF